MKNAIIVFMKIFYDITSKEFFIEEDETFFVNDFCFTDGENSTVIFNNLSFGIIIQKETEKILEETFPKNDIQYLETDQQVLEHIYCEQIFMGEEYNYTVWVNNSGEKIENSFVRNVPKPPSPYISWIWSNETHCWIAPIPYPDSDMYYIWNEEGQEWVIPQESL